jgi:hypothetical protein
MQDRHDKAAALTSAIRANVEAYYNGILSSAEFGERQRALWDLAHEAGEAARVRLLILDDETLIKSAPL